MISSDGGRQMKAMVNWVEVNWGKQDVELALACGVSRERVRQARKTYGGGVKPEGYRKRTCETAEDRLAGMETSDKTLPELAKMADCDEQRVSVLLKGLGKVFKRRARGNAKYDWTKFPQGWEFKTDKELAFLVGVDDPAVVTQWRNRHGYGKMVPANVAMEGRAS